MSRWWAVLRLARRDALLRRSRRHTVLVGLMVLLPVLLASVGAVVSRSSQLDPQDVVTLRLGTGAVQAEVFGSFDGAPAMQDVTANTTAGTGDGRRAMPTAEIEDRLATVVGPRNRLVRLRSGPSTALLVGDGVVRAGLGELDLAALGAGSPITLASGRRPAADREVIALQPPGDTAVLPVGASVTALDGDRTLTVVGTFRASGSSGVSQVLGRPGALIAPPTGGPTGGPTGSETPQVDEVRWFVVGPDPVTWSEVLQVNAFGGLVISRAAVAENPLISMDLRGSYGPDVTTVVTAAVIITLVLLQVCLMVGPAIAVGARRNERRLAIVAAAGGAPRQVAGVVLAGAGVIGLAASLAGAGLGAAAGAATVRLLSAQGSDLPRVDVRVADLAALVLVGTVTAVAAAALPALRVARLDVVAAITGRRPQTAPRLRVPALWLGVFAVGAGLAWWAAGRGRQSLTVLGIAVGELGLVLAASAIVVLFARLAGRAPVAARFTLRDAARQSRRTVPAVAATIAAVAAGVGVLVFGASQADVDYRSARQQTAVGTGSVQLPDPAGSYGSVDRPADPETVAAALRDNVGGTVGFGYAVPREGGGDYREPAVRLPDVCSPRRGCAGMLLPVTFVDPAVAALVSPQPERASAAIAAGRLVVFDPALVDRDGQVTVTISSTGGPTEPAGDVRRKVPALLLDGGERLDAVLAPRALAGQLDVRPEVATLYVRPQVAPTPAQLARLDLALARIRPHLEYSVETGASRPGHRNEFVVLGGLAVLVALAGTFVAVGLAAADARPDLGTLAAVGADPSIRRRIGAGQAAAIAVPGALVGAVVGLLAGTVLVRLNGAGSGYAGADAWRVVVPAADVATLALGIPLLAVAIGWLTARSRLEVTRRLGE